MLSSSTMATIASDSSKSSNDKVPVSIPFIKKANNLVYHNNYPYIKFLRMLRVGFSNPVRIHISPVTIREKNCFIIKSDTSNVIAFLLNVIFLLKTVAYDLCQLHKILGKIIFVRVTLTFFLNFVRSYCYR